MGILYGAKSILVSYLERALRKLKMNTSLEQALLEFSEECQLEEAENFAQIVAIGKKSGGNLVRIIEKSVHSICLKIETEEEIEKRMERIEYELSKGKDYDYAVVNDTVENAVRAIEEIIEKEKNK